MRAQEVVPPRVFDKHTKSLGLACLGFTFRCGVTDLQYKMTGTATVPIQSAANITVYAATVWLRLLVVSMAGCLAVSRDDILPVDIVY